jgi:UDP-N-acetylmuramyl tripeptide synthase
MTEPPTVLDSRRLLGPSLLMDRAGAVLEVEFGELPPELLIKGWLDNLRLLAGELGWPPPMPCFMQRPGGASLAFEAPSDLLLTATEINEWAWARAVERAGGPVAEALTDARVRINQFANEERKPRLIALEEAANAHGVSLYGDDESVTIGMGAGSRTFTLDALPDAAAIDWSAIHDVPLALVTGSNGKTTTVRLMAAMLRAQGAHPGWSSTDGVLIDGERIAEGDYSGPEGARLVLRDQRVDAAILETARGGILRRGLAVTHADVAVITNIAADHFGEYGITDLGGLAATKLVVAKVIDDEGRLVVNADDAMLRLAAEGLVRRVPKAWFGLDAASVAEAVGASGHESATVIDGRFVLQRGEERIDLLGVDEAPVTLGGSAVHNVANALAASLAAWCLGCAPGAIRSALATFGQRNSDNPGRASLFDVNGVRVLLDYAHNPHGMQALAAVARALPGGRRGLVLGQAGNRDDESIRGLARSAWPIGVDHVVVKEMEGYRRGRAIGEIPGILADEFRRLGLPPDAIEYGESEVDAVGKALDWARPGDLLVLTVHSSRAAVLELLAARGARELRGVGTTV